MEEDGGVENIDGGVKIFVEIRRPTTKIVGPDLALDPILIGYGAATEQPAPDATAEAEISIL